MTVIAWDGETLAADRLVSGGYRKTKTRKIHRLGNGNLIGLAGEMSSILALLEWFQMGCVKTEFPNLHNEQETPVVALLVTPKRKIFVMDGNHILIPIVEKQFAIGSGGQFALGAMLAGADAVEAVRIASQLSESCGLGVDILKL